MFLKYITQYFDLYAGMEEKNKTIEYIEQSASFRGARLWILITAIIIASVGLNMNSTAVLIGAMLISPLMGPIISAGFGLATYDFELLHKSLRNLFFAIIISVSISTLYFYLTPFKGVHSELLARTSPTIFDIIIAFVGGVAGMISISRTEKGNPLPGVAIATALMPPLCTAGYAIASGNIGFLIGAGYLFFINSAFIFFATFSIVRILRYPIKQDIIIDRQKYIKKLLTTISIFIMLPGIWFAHTLYRKEQYTQLANTFIQEQFINKGIIVLNKNIQVKPNKIIELSIFGKHYSPEEVNGFNQILSEQYGLSSVQINIKEASEKIDIGNIKDTIIGELNKTKQAETDDEKTIQKLQSIIARNSFDNDGILAEIQVIFPDIKGINLLNSNWETETIGLIGIYESKTTLNDIELDTLGRWLVKRLKINRIEFLYKGSKEI